MRRSVALLFLAGLLPVVALGATFGAITFRNERHSVQQRAQIDARFAGALLAVKLRSSILAVQMVAQSPAFDDGDPDLGRFKTLASRIVANAPDWRTLSVANPAGERLLDVPQPIGGRQGGRVVEPASLERTLATHRPQIGDVVLGPKGGLAFAVRAPVIRAGQVRFVVSAVVSAKRLRELLLFQPLPLGWSAAVVDGAGRIAADSGGRPQAGDRSDVVKSWAPVAGTTWRVRVTTPRLAFSAPIRNAVLLVSAAAVLSLLLLAMLARMLTTELKQIRQREAAQLQSQRMEALGRLTGGVAHDFNNLLTPIVGGLDMIGRRVTDERTLRYVAAAAASAERARSLVSRLLSFSRRQSLEPSAIDLAELLSAMSDLIDRSLTPAVAVETRTPTGLCAVHADKGQLELAILNLAINARDAMPNGGTIRISAGPAVAEQTAGLGSGDFVFLAVADTGTGMDAKTMRQARDPFFTTKPIERGTGLGLSMVDGFAAQSGGALHLASTPGEGTVATVILPCSAEPRVVPRATDTARDLPPVRILLVDDEEPVRRATADMLADAGHDVSEAASVDAALLILEADPAFDAVVTDYVMPGRSGGDLARYVRQTWPRIPVLLASGYVTDGEELPPEVHKLTKPFSRDQLLAALGSLIAAAD